MKKIFGILLFAIALIACFVLVSAPAFSQLTMEKDYKGNTLTKTVKTLSKKASGVVDTTQSILIPWGQHVIAYLHNDTVASACTLNVAIQGSSDGVRWTTLTPFAQVVAAGTIRSEIAYPDPYLRFIRTYSGTAYIYGGGIQVFPR